MQRLSTSLICLTAFALACSPVGQTTDTADTLTAPTDATSGTTGDSDSATATSTASATDSPTLPSTTEIESSTSAPTTTDETTTSGDTCEIVPGTLYAPCILPEHACTEGECIITPTGSICAPGCDGCGDDACLAEVGDDGGACIDDHCVPSCDSPDDCLGGAFCSGLGFCYWPDPQEPVDPCLEPGEVFGPCKDGGECDAGLECVIGSGTWICLAPCGDELCDESCAWALGIEAHLACGKTDHCAVGCTTDDECHPDAVCDTTLGACAWPRDPDAIDCMTPGDLYGPCIDHECGPGLACFSAKAGEICVPLLPGDIDVTDPQVEQCATEVGGIFHCIEELGWCAAECGDECAAGVDGVVCDAWTGHCVWPYPMQDPPGSAFNPCDPAQPDQCAAGLTCIERTGAAHGRVCAPPCEVCGDPEVIADADNLGHLDPICFDDVDACLVPCASGDDCNLDAICSDGACVWLVK